jgi:hypothetical protein
VTGEATRPVLSRRTVAPQVAARGMRSAAELARGEGNGLVSAEPPRRHLAWLSSRGIGRCTAADAAKVPHSTISLIVDGLRLQIRAQTERRILAVTEAAAADRAYIDGEATWRLLDELLASGYSKARLASEILGRRVTGLQMKRGRVTARNAERVRRVYARLRYATPAGTLAVQALLQEMREEGFRLDKVLREMAALAERRGLPEPTLQSARKGERQGCLRYFEVELIGVLHAALVEEPA